MVHYNVDAGHIDTWILVEHNSYKEEEHKWIKLMSIQSLEELQLDDDSFL